MFDLDQLSAQNERFFADHWTDTPWFLAAARRNVPIVFGAKGSGKSALLRYLTELQREANISYPGLDLADFRHERVRLQVNDLVGNLTIDHTTLLANYWRHLFLLHCLHAVSTSATPTNNREEHALEMIRVALSRQDIRCAAHHSLLGYLLSAKQYLDECLLRPVAPDEQPLIGGLTRIELTRLESYPSDDAFTTACLAAAALVQGGERHVCLVVDGLDQVHKADRGAHVFVLSTIVQAVKRLALDQSLNKAFSVKILVPRELFFAIADRDLDQYASLQVHLFWDPDTLTALLERRLAAACVRAGAKDGARLESFLPDMLPNGQSTLDYLIRHTMYRPRQLFTYFKSIADGEQWSLKEPDAWQPATGERILRLIVAATIAVTQTFIQEYLHKYPQLDSLLKQLAGLASVTELRALKVRLAEGTDQGLNILYDCGAIGIVEAAHPGIGQDLSRCYRLADGQQVPINCEFVYKPGARPFWLPAMPDDSLIAIHPMLVRYCGATVTGEYVVG